MAAPGSSRYLTTDEPSNDAIGGGGGGGGGMKGVQLLHDILGGRHALAATATGMTSSSSGGSRLGRGKTGQDVVESGFRSGMSLGLGLSTGLGSGGGMGMGMGSSRTPSPLGPTPEPSPFPTPNRNNNNNNNDSNDSNNHDRGNDKNVSHNSIDRMTVGQGLAPGQGSGLAPGQGLAPGPGRGAVIGGCSIDLTEAEKIASDAVVTYLPLPLPIYLPHLSQHTFPHYPHPPNPPSSPLSLSPGCCGRNRRLFPSHFETIRRQSFRRSFQASPQHDTTTVREGNRGYFATGGRR